MTTETPTKTKHVCQYCQREFSKESTLLVHLCEQKRRYREQNETGVQLGFQAYLRFYTLTQGSAKLKTFDDFAASSYYRAFVKFGRYCQDIKAINFLQFVNWLLQHNKKLDHWCRDSMYEEYLFEYLRVENPNDALSRAIEQSIAWEEDTDYPSRDYLRHGNTNVLCYAIKTGKISPWVIYNSESGLEFLERLNQEQLAIVWTIIEPDFWQKKFRDYPADTEYLKEMLSMAGW